MAIIASRRGNESPRAQRPYVVMQLQKSAKQPLVSNKLARSAPKRVAVRVNGDLGIAGSGHESVSGRGTEEMADVSDCAADSGAGSG